MMGALYVVITFAVLLIVSGLIWLAIDELDWWIQLARARKAFDVAITAVDDAEYAPHDHAVAQGMLDAVTSYAAMVLELRRRRPWRKL
jgi:hypothetical protein